MNVAGLIYDVSTWLIPIVVAITFHEAAHGWVAHRLGDDTAFRLGRVTFNPFKHVDTFGTIVFPLMLAVLKAPFVFGYAKPVPVNFRNLRQPKQDMVWVAAAGPGINLLLALACGVGLHATDPATSRLVLWLQAVLDNGLLINVVLAVFNMLPLPPLDGGRVAVGLLPAPWDRKLASVELYGMPILFGLLLLPPLIGMQLGIDLNIAAYLLLPPVDWVATLILNLTGH